jgi:hypothetical protein
MPYDPIKARQLIRTSAAYERLPGSEYVLELAKTLEAADTEIRDHAKKTGQIEDDARRYQREAEADREALRKLREGAGHNFEVAVAALKEISLMTKGAKKKAIETLDILFPAAALAPKPNAEPSITDRIEVP